MTLFGSRRRRANLSAIAPNPLAVVPSSGIVGVLVTITGSGLSATTNVKFNGVDALSLVVFNDTTLTALVPPLSLGPVPVLVISPNGSQVVPGGFTVSLT